MKKYFLWALSIITLYYAPLKAQTPVMKFIQGEKKTFKTANLAKAKGISLAIDYPKEWKTEARQEAYIMQKFIGQYDKVQAQFEIQLHTFAEAEAVSTLNEAMRSNQLARLQPYTKLFNPTQDITFGQGMSYKIKEQDGFWLKGIQQVSVPTPTYFFHKTYLWTYSNTLVVIPFATSGSTEEEAKKNFSKYESLFKLILESCFIGN